MRIEVIGVILLEIDCRYRFGEPFSHSASPYPRNSALTRVSADPEPRCSKLGAHESPPASVITASEAWNETNELNVAKTPKAPARLQGLSVPQIQFYAPLLAKIAPDCREPRSHSHPQATSAIGAVLNAAEVKTR